MSLITDLSFKFFGTVLSVPSNTGGWWGVLPVGSRIWIQLQSLLKIFSLYLKEKYLLFSCESNRTVFQIVQWICCFSFSKLFVLRMLCRIAREKGTSAQLPSRQNILFFLWDFERKRDCKMSATQILFLKLECGEKINKLPATSAGKHVTVDTRANLVTGGKCGKTCNQSGWEKWLKFAFVSQWWKDKTGSSL